MLFLVAACTADPTEPDPTSPSLTDPGGTAPPPAWTVPGATEPPPFDGEALGAGLDEVLARALTLDASPVMEAYDAAMAWSGGGCPYTYGYPYGYGWLEAWYAQCESPAGATFSGYVSDYTDGAYRGLYMSATILTPDGTTLTGAGYFAKGASVYGPYRYTSTYMDGVVSYDGPSAAGTWVEEQIQPHELAVDVGEAISGAWRYVYANGQYTGAAGAVDTVDFSEVYVDSSYACPEPTGSIAVRTPDGDWFDIAYEGSADPCDGCGVARWRGLEMGEICADFTLWTAP